jgi:sugar/nucleoside kinase (ribokinase family)
VVTTKPKPTRPTALPLRRAARRPRLVAIGDLVLDIVVRAERPPVTGTDVAGQISFRVGGSAANTCRAFAQAGGAATFIGAVGDDHWGRRLTASLRRDRVDVRVARLAMPSARLVALIDPTGERTFVTQRGAADRLTPAHVRRTWPAAVDVLHLPAYSLLAEPLASAARAALDRARQGAALVSLDVASHGPLLELGRAAATTLLVDVGADVLLANADEAAALAGRRDMRQLLDIAPVLVIKEGAAGCRLLWRAGSERAAPDVLQLDVATKPIDALDTTGAGDAFDAGFLHALAVAGGTAAGRHSAQALRRAAVAGHHAAARLLTRPRPELAD